MVDEHNSVEPSVGSTISAEATPSNSENRDKTGQRKRHFDSKRGGRGQDKKRKNLSRKDWNRGNLDRRERNNEWQERKRRKVDENGNSTDAAEPSYMNIQFPEAEIAAEERRPKRKVAVMIGYAGTGYCGLQINHKQRTIEGDIFAAFVKAKAISKANASDPRKSSFVRCARTDKGVHAAGNMISLKLIIEDPDIVKKINDELPPQIRIWGIQRTNNAFSCYQICDSRWYEYLMPSYCLLPPHPKSFLGKKVLDSVTEMGVEEEYAKRLAEVKNYWDEVEKNDIQPILDSLDPETREGVEKRMYASEDTLAKSKPSHKVAEVDETAEKVNMAAEIKISDSSGAEAKDEPTQQNAIIASELATAPEGSENSDNQGQATEEAEPKEAHPIDRALRQIKAAYVAAKRRYRTTPERVAQLQEALNHYVGTKNFHNYTVQKSHSDPSSKRSIKSFVVNPEPIQINDTQWLSLKVHGQSFMMHQIRKMVGMAVLTTRCATPFSVMTESYGDVRISIPKAPGLGLLLERPVYENYNKRAIENFNLEQLDFGKYERDIQKFKETQIYQRIFETEEKENAFHTFFHQIDHFKSDYFMWVTAGGIGAAKLRTGPQERVPEELGWEYEEGDEQSDGAGDEG
ncbi:pseudouridine synthase [Xylariaceae sp. FL0016]|nr:pseudouridine synthase [Xylariaceae sp. FL0016]